MQINQIGNGKGLGKGKGKGKGAPAGNWIEVQSHKTLVQTHSDKHKHQTNAKHVQVNGEWLWRPATTALALNSRDRRLINRQFDQEFISLQKNYKT